MPSRVLASLLTACLLLSAAPAWATEGSDSGGEAVSAEAEPAPATVSFVDTRALTVDLETLEAKQGIEVKLHNDLSREQTAHLQLVGLDEYEEVEGLFASEEDEQKIPAGGSATLALKLGTTPQSDREAHSYAMTLVASGESGGLTRRTLTISIAAAEAGDEEPEGNELNPARAVDVTLVAVNYLPSLISDVPYCLFVLALALLVAIAIVFGVKKRMPRLGVLLFAVAVLVAVVALGLFTFDDPWDQRSANLISARPIAVSSEVENGTWGTVASENGTIAQLVVEGGELKPQALRSATALKGKYDFTPGAEGGEGAATVNVRDFWPWALLTICLGIGVGYWLRRWFQSERPAAKARGRLDRILEVYAEELERLRSQDKDTPYRDLSIDQRLAVRVAEINDVLDANEASSAVTKIDALETYVEKFLSLRAALESLDNSARQLAGAYKVGDLGVDLGDVAGYQEAQRLLEGTVDSPQRDSDSTKLDKRLAAVEAQNELVPKVTRQLRVIQEHLAAARIALPKADGKQVKALEGAVDELTAVGRKTLRAADAEALKATSGDYAKAVEGLSKALASIKAAGDHGPVAALTLPFHAMQPFSPVYALEPEREIFDAYLPNWRQTPTQPNAEVRCSVVGAGPGEAVQLHPGDRVIFAIEIEAAEPESRLPSEVEIDFGDDASETRTLPKGHGKVSFTVSHAYLEGKDVQFVVRSLPDRTELVHEDLAVAEQPRAVESRIKVAETDRIAGWAAFLLAAGSGMAILYFADPAWGEPVDYLKAVIWGGTASEGLKFVASIADRTWPSS